MPVTALGRAAADRGRAWLGLSQADDSLIDMRGNELPGETSAAVRSATITALHQHLGDHYTRRPGVASLCKMVATQLATFGVVVNDQNGVVITGGSQEARFVAVRALATNTTVFLPEQVPSTRYRDAARFAGAAIVRFDPDSVLPSATTGVLMIANPNPASGQLWPTAILERLAGWASQAGLTVIADETDAALLRPELSFTPFATLPGAAERTLTLGSFAATPGIGAWHVAWFAGSAALVARARDLKQSMTICSPALSQYAALAGMDAQPAAGLQAYSTQLAALTAVLEREAVAFRAPDTVAYVVADVHALGGGDVVTAACAAHGLQVTSGSDFGAPDSVRIGLPTGALDAALERLSAALHSLRTQPIKVSI